MIKLHIKHKHTFKTDTYTQAYPYFYNINTHINKITHLETNIGLHIHTSERMDTNAHITQAQIVDYFIFAVHHSWCSFGTFLRLLKTKLL